MCHCQNLCAVAINDICLSAVAGTSQYFDGDDKGAAGLAGDSEMYPYVSFTISVDWMRFCDCVSYINAQ